MQGLYVFTLDNLENQETDDWLVNVQRSTNVASMRPRKLKVYDRRWQSYSRAVCSINLSILTISLILPLLRIRD